MLIELVKDTVAAGRPVRKGEKMNLPDSEARALINYGHARAVPLTYGGTPCHLMKR